jgi:hypothetical protein
MTEAPPPPGLSAEDPAPRPAAALPTSGRGELPVGRWIVFNTIVLLLIGRFFGEYVFVNGPVPVFILFVLGVLYVAKPDIYRRWGFTRVSPLERLLSAGDHRSYMRGLGWSFMAWAIMWLASAWALRKDLPIEADYLMVPVALFATALGGWALMRSLTRSGSPTNLAVFALAGGAGILAAALAVQHSFPRGIAADSLWPLLRAEWQRELRFNLSLAVVCAAVPTALGAAALLIRREETTG